MPWLGYSNWLCAYMRMCASWEFALIFRTFPSFSHTSISLTIFPFFLKTLNSTLSPLPVIPDVTHMLWCSAEGREFVWVLPFFLPHHHPSPANFSSSFSPPVASAVIDMPPAINQLSSRAEQRPLSERTGLAALEKRAREGELIQLSSRESPTAHHFTSLWNFLTTYTRTQHHPHLFSGPPLLLSQINKKK